ncbi:uncharacterized protein LOC141898924 [Tubulanus polymorphus]|uniref:uncharacterized protein LOC141898924 n=1 Tax=Tubulanus polymorphus TaxID=672921 RepID=UPI003DA41D40
MSVSKDEKTKQKDTRTSLAGWLTRAIKAVDDVRIRAAVEPAKQRITSQLGSLMTASSRYVDSLESDEEIEKAGLWLDTYYNRAMEALEKLDSFSYSQSEKGQQASLNPSAHEFRVNQPMDDGENFVPVSSATPEPNIQDAPISGQPVSFVTIDSWIDNLIDEVETITTADTASQPSLEDAFLRMELGPSELRQGPTESGTPHVRWVGIWPRFIEQFYLQVHCRPGIVDARRMDLLQNHVKGEAKKLIYGLVYSGRNYSTALKELKFVFGHRVHVARTYIDSISTGSVVNSYDSISLRSFYVSVRDCLITLKQMNYMSEIGSSDLLFKVTRRIPVDRRSKWNDFVRRISRTRDPTLFDLENWLRDCVEADFGPFSLQNKPRKSSNHVNVANGPQRPHSSQIPDRSMLNIPSSDISRQNASLERGDSAINQNAISTETDCNNVFFQVLPVTVQGNNGRRIATHALLDSGSDVTLIHEDLADELGLPGEKQLLTISTLNSSVARQSRCVTFTVRGNDPDSKVVNISRAWTTHNNINCPPQTFSEVSLNKLSHLNGLSFTDYSPCQVKILIGANVPQVHVQLEVREGSSQQPAAIKTRLGWCLFGNMSYVNSSVANVNTIVSDPQLIGHSLTKQLDRFWSTESFAVAYPDRVGSVEDQRASKILSNTTRLVDGHYEVGMLWRDNESVLPDNYSLARKRYDLLVNRLASDQVMKEGYCNTLNGYITDGYARLLSPSETMLRTSRTWYIPHHCVFNSNKPGKFRVVFDAASKSQGLSLNDLLMTGPDLLNSLFGVLQRFRLYETALVADVRAMFHQVKTSELDSDSLRFLWRPDASTGPPSTYKMIVHIFGAKDSPSCANYALKRSALDNALEFSDLAVNSVIRDFYVDDFLKSVPGDEAAVQLASEVTEVLLRGGFHLTKWMASSKNVLMQIPQAERANPSLDLDFSELPIERTLGIKWNAQIDCFVFRPVIKPVAPTKRGILSAVSSVFDPLGFLSPFTLKAKCLIQDMWHCGLGWDEKISGHLFETWCAWQDELLLLHDLRIPRLHLFLSPSAEMWHEHRNEHSAVLVICVITRLELQGAVMSIRLGETLKSEISEIRDVVYWTDSQTVLRYIHNEKKRFKTFVANRVSEIRESSSPNQWKYVPSNSNPADDCTRGLSAVALLTSSHRWFNGPEFLQQAETSWPPQPNVGSISDLDENIKAATTANRTLLTLDELKFAEVCLVAGAQRECFPDAYLSLQESKMKLQHPLKCLDPFFDGACIRIGGRMHGARYVPLEARHQLLLPYNHHITELLMRKEHLLNYHAGPEHVIASTRQKYWPIKARVVAKRVISSCFGCRRRSVVPRIPFMSDLPAYRIMSHCRPFQHCGVDYFGPMYIKRGRSNLKVWVCLFTCLVTRAIHLELAKSLETDSFLLVLCNFIGRRGRPDEMFSNNGSNFIGAEKELKECLINWNQSRLSEFLSEKGTRWHFNPPSSPHFGGAWERLVRTVKVALKSVLRGRSFFENVLRTTLIEVEAVVNSRPLTYISSKPQDYTPLTPNHFLHGGATSITPQGVFHEREISSRKRWRQSLVLADHVWQRWLSEYLPSLTVRGKWFTENRNVRKGD